MRAHTGKQHACTPRTVVRRPALHPHSCAPTAGQPSLCSLCSHLSHPAASSSPPPTPTASTQRYAVIGDYGFDGSNEASVATLIRGWNTASALTGVLTVGDNNYGALGRGDEGLEPY